MKYFKIGFPFLACVLAVNTTAAQAESTLKPGLWETRTTKMVMDGKDMAPQMAAATRQMTEAMAKMPSEQRKKLELAMGQQGGDGMSRRICVSAEMAARDQTMVPRPARAECEQPKFNRSGNRTTFEMACKPAGGGSMAGKGETVVTGDSVVTKMDTVSTDAKGQKHTMVAETQMKFISTDCGGIKPLDQLMKEMKPVPAASSAAPRKPAAK